MASRVLTSCSRVPMRVGRAYYSSSSPVGGYVAPAFIDSPRPVLGEYRAGVPQSNGAKNVTRAAKVTTLANGLKVASLTSNDIGVSVGLAVNVGSRNETRSNAGASHLLKFAAFGTSTDKPGYQWVRELEAVGATFNASAGREQLLFSSEVVPSEVNKVVELISNVLRPKLSYHEVTAQGEAVKADAERLQADPVSSLLELLHRQAYRSKGLGQPLVAIQENIHHLNAETMAKFVDAHYSLDQSVFIGVGLEHEELVQSVEAAFAQIPSRKHEKSSDLASKYAGGESLVPAVGHTHLAIAFEGASLKGDSKDAIAFGVLQHVLGSAVNGNAGSQVGTGVTSRLNKVLPSNEGAYVVSAFNFSYSDSGLFGVYAETRDAPGRLLSSITAELGKLRNLDANELAKGKALYKLAVLDQGSRRSSALEFIANQVVASGKAVTPEEYAAQIDSISAEDVARVAKKAFSSRPTIVAVGDVSGLPTAEEIASTVNPK